MPCQRSVCLFNSALGSNSHKMDGGDGVELCFLACQYYVREVRMATGMYPSGIAGTFSSLLRRIHPVLVPVNCLGYRFLSIPVPVGHRSGNRYTTGTAYPINKDTWGRSFAIEDISSSPGYKCRSLGDAEEKERGCEEDEQR